MASISSRFQIALPDKLDGKNWNIWKKCMLNAFLLHEAQDVVLNGLTKTFKDNSTTTYTDETIKNMQKDSLAQNMILTHIVGTLSVLTDGCENAHDMWEALLNRFEGNSQMKRTKFIGLEQEFDNFRMIEGESVEDMYTRMSHIQNGYTALGKQLTNDRVVGKLLRAMPQEWEMLRVTLETQLATKTIETEELINHFRNFESRMKQRRIDSQPITTAMTVYEPQDEKSELAMLVKQFNDFRTREKRFNNNRRRNNKQTYCFECNKKGHTIENCFVLHPELAPWYKKDGDSKRGRFEDRERRSNDKREKEREEYKKEKRRNHARTAQWGGDSSDGGETSDSDIEAEPKTPNLAFTATMDELIEKAVEDTIRLEQQRKKNKAQATLVDKTPTKPKEVHNLHKTDFNDVFEDFISSNSSKNYIELEKCDELEQEVMRLRGRLSSTEELLSKSESLVKSCKAEIQTLKNQNFTNKNCECENYKNEIIKLKDQTKNCFCEKSKIEIINLKNEIFKLKVENKIVKSANSTKSDVDNFKVGQKPHDKSGLGYKREIGNKPVLSKPKNHTVKRELNQHPNKRHAFMYGTYADKNKSHKSRTQNVTRQHNRFHFKQHAPLHHGGNPGVKTDRLYKRGPSGWFYEVVNTHVPRIIQPNESKHRVPKHYINTPKTFSTNQNKTSLDLNALPTEPRMRKEKLISHFKNHFIKGTYERSRNSRPTCASCNYCCKTGHISLECPARKSINYIWKKKEVISPELGVSRAC